MGQRLCNVQCLRFNTTTGGRKGKRNRVMYYMRTSKTSVSDKQNVSLSVNSRDLVCVSCPEQHAFVLPESAGIPVCQNLSGQSFSPLFRQAWVRGALAPSASRTPGCQIFSASSEKSSAPTPDPPVISPGVHLLRALTLGSPKVHRSLNYS